MKPSLTSNIVTIENDFKIKQNQIEDYNGILEEYQLRYSIIDNYYFIGEVNWTQGWILHISVIKIQLLELLKVIIPLLKNEKVPFKVVKNEDIANSILNGQFGYIHLGKLISIYPNNNQQVISLAKKLLELTRNFRGPDILTDRHLGSVIYTRYGACKPIIRTNEKGSIDTLIYDSTGKLVKDKYTMPFTFPSDIEWPFSEITSAEVPKKENILQKKYRPIELLKEDAKGYVKKALWLKKIYHIKWCVLKEGKKNMNADEYGRDMRDRLKWQFTLHQDLQTFLPIPKVYDFFEENDDAYLVMEHINGVHLDDIIVNIFNYRTWKELQRPEQRKLLYYAEQILEVIEKMHNKGYVHRDITPVNFLVTKEEKLWMIDLELSYYRISTTPFPPYRLGTSGFMSPEQQEALMPTIQQDIYSIGAILIVLLTGLLPGKFATRNKNTLKKQLTFFIPDRELVELIGNCFDELPEKRPQIHSLKNALENVRINLLSETVTSTTKNNFEKLEKEDLKNYISHALKGLALAEMKNSDLLWLSKTIQEDGLDYYQMESGSIYPGFYEGLSGILYLVGCAKNMGFPTNSLIISYEKSLTFIENQYTQNLNVMPAGLYGGTSGVAMALSMGVESGLIIKDIIINKIKSLLENENTDGLGIVKGLAGKGIALLQTSSVLGDNFVLPLLEKIVIDISQQQQKDGSWLTLTDDKKKSFKITGFGHGVAGICCFLLSYIRKYDSNAAICESVTKALQWLANQAQKKQNSIFWHLNNKTKDNSHNFQDGSAGIALCFIKAYEAFGNTLYRQLAEAILRSYPLIWNCRDITLAYGLVGISEVYLEAARVLKSSEWQERSDWTTQFILHNFQEQKDGSIYWLVDSTPYSTASFMTGNSGIIYFLIRYYKPDVLNHPLI